MVFNEYLREWARGPLNLYGYLREWGVSETDNKGFRREVAVPDAVPDFFGREVRRWMNHNWYMSNAFTVVDYDADSVLFDRVVFDFDNPGNPDEAVQAALGFASRLYERYGATPIVARTGFKGAAVYVFYDREVDWPTQESLFKLLPLLSSNPKLIDSNMNQWNRLARIPLTYNLKHNERRKVIIIHPEKVEDYTSFSWSLAKPLDVSKVRIEKPILPPIPRKVIVRKTGRPRLEWIERLIKTGLPDGRKRAIGLIIMPYLANYLKLSDEEVLDKCLEFIENSCRNHGKCEKIYESWLRSQLKTVKNYGYKIISREKFRSEYPDLYEIISKLTE